MPSREPPGWAVRRVTPGDLWRRVTLRRTVTPGGEARAYSDVVGTLEAWSDGVLTVRRRTGELVSVADADVVASRVVEPVSRGHG